MPSSAARSARRTCSRSGCAGAPIATLTFSYADAQAVLGPLSGHRDPGGYDLCRVHADTLTVPQGWDVVRLPLHSTPVGPTDDDLLALANAVREIGLRHDDPLPERIDQASPPPGVVSLDERRRRRSERF